MGGDTQKLQHLLAVPFEKKCEIGVAWVKVPIYFQDVILSISL